MSEAYRLYVAAIYAVAIITAASIFGFLYAEGQVAPLKFQWKIFQLQRQEARGIIEQNLRSEVIIPKGPYGQCG